jgi:hypothetical protein
LEEAYGFTRLRTYPHVFMVWLGILLLVIVILEASGRQRAFALATMLAIVGFTATLTLVNVDALIARINLERAAAGQPLDAQYLASLSSDAVPTLVAQHRSEPLTGLDVALACYLELQPEASAHWQSWNLSTSKASEVLQGILVPSVDSENCHASFFMD